MAYCKFVGRRNLADLCEFLAALGGFGEAPPVTWYQAPRPQQTDPKLTVDSDLARLAALTTLPTSKLRLDLTIDPTWTKKLAKILNAGGLAPRSAHGGRVRARTACGAEAPGASSRCVTLRLVI